MNWYFYNHINKKSYCYSHENITSYGIPLLASKIVHPSLSKDMKSSMQIKRGNSTLLLINATLSKNQLYKHNNKILYHQQARRHRAIFQIYLHVILLMSAIYFRVIIMIGFWFFDTRGLCWGIRISHFESLS